MGKSNGNGKKIASLETAIKYIEDKIRDNQNAIIKELEKGNLERGIWRADILNGQNRIESSLKTHIEDCDTKIDKLNNFRYWILGGVGMAAFVVTGALMYLSSNIR